MRVVSVAEMKKLEQEADAAGNSFAQMMKRAGQATAVAAWRLLDGQTDGLVVILIGPGNNGGDGLVAASVLAARGCRVRMAMTRPRSDDDINWQCAHSMGIPFTSSVDSDSLNTLKGWLMEATLVIDALLGTGVRLPVTGEAAAILTVLQEAKQSRLEARPLLTELVGPARQSNTWRLLAVDVPSGLDADSGAVDTLTPQADATITMGAVKQGLCRFPGAELVGDLLIGDIDLRPAAITNYGEEMIDAALIAGLLPQRRQQSHKGSFGSVMVAAGSVNFSGAALLAAAGAARSGCGIVTLASIPSVLASADAIIPEATRLYLPSDAGVIDAGGAALLHNKLNDYRALLVGPGITTEKTAARFLRALLTGKESGHKGNIGFVSGKPVAETEHLSLPPMILDADALNIIAAEPDLWQYVPTGSVVTPHPGEMARLLDTTIAAVQQDRWVCAREAAAKWHCTVVLKGAFTVIASDGPAALAPFANPALASGGTGDVLAGVIAGLMAQGMTGYDAARCGVYLHGCAGEWARRELGEAGVLASDLLPYLPKVRQSLRNS